MIVTLPPDQHGVQARRLALLQHADALRAAGRNPEALRCLDAALALDPVDAVTHCKRGLALKALRRWDEALACFDRGIALAPALAPAHMDRGNVLQGKGLLLEALAAYDRALALQPKYPDALCNRGVVLNRLCRFDEAIASFDAALALEPRLEAALLNRCTSLGDSGRHAEALGGFARILDRRPDLAIAHYNEALCRLRLGEFERGWAKFEWRWRYEDLGLVPRKLAQPLWLGQDEICGRTVLVHCEQGLGDTIQFCRYSETLAQRGARVVLLVQRELVRLLGSLRGAAHVVAEGMALPEFDCHLPMLSLPHALGTRIDTVPAAIPYLRADPERVQQWSPRLGAAGRRPRIGLAWSGNRDHPNDFNRSIALELFRVVTTGVEADFIAIQNQVRESDRDEVPRQGIQPHGMECGDFADAAGLVANLDLVISVDSAGAHLAGALGRPVWILLPYLADGRWMVGREDSPWYPTARLFRQSEPGSWRGVLATVREALETFISS